MSNWRKWFDLTIAATIVLFVTATSSARGADTVPNTPFRLADAPLEEATEAVLAANSVLRSIVDMQIGSGLDSNDNWVLVPIKQSATVTRAAIFTVPGYKYIFYVPEALGQRLDDLIAVNQADIDLTEALLLSDPATVTGGFPKSATLVGVEMMRNADVRRSDMLAMLLLHEAGHLYCGHGQQDGQWSGSDSLYNFDDTAAKRAEGEADRFAATALISTLLGKQSAQQDKDLAVRIVSSVTMAGFAKTSARLKAGLPVIADTSVTHEDLELRILRMFDTISGLVPFADRYNEHILELIDETENLRALFGDAKPIESGGALCPIPTVERPASELSSDEALLAKAAEYLAQRQYGPAAREIDRVLDERQGLWSRADPQRVRLLIYLANAQYLNAEFLDARATLSEALTVVTAMGLRARERGAQVLGPLAVIERYYGDDRAADGYCSEIQGVDLAGMGAPSEFVNEVSHACQW